MNKEDYQAEHRRRVEALAEKNEARTSRKKAAAEDEGRVAKGGGNHMARLADIIASDDALSKEAATKLGMQLGSRMQALADGKFQGHFRTQTQLCMDDAGMSDNKKQAALKVLGEFKLSVEIKSRGEDIEFPRGYPVSPTRR